MLTKSLDCGFSMPELGMGTWGMGGYMSHDPKSDDESDVAALRAGLDLGFTHIDTAEIYGGGQAEVITGRAIAGRDRSKLFITSKVWTSHLSFDGVERAVEGSLKRLGSDYLDLYLIHQVSDETPLEETMRGLNRVADEGLVKNIGVSNFSAERLKRAQAASSRKIVANQVHYNLAVREPELKLLKHCQENDVMLIAWRPVQAKEILQADFALMKSLCAKYGKSPVQLAINWLLAQKNVTSVAAMRSAKHIPENLAACGFRMEPADVEALRESFPGKSFKSDAVPLR